MDESDGEKFDVSFDPSLAVRLNRDRLEARFASASLDGHRWLVECRDLWDASDRDAGVYFEECPDDAAVDLIVYRCADGNPHDRLLGVFDLREPLAAQGGGLTRAEWLAGRVEQGRAVP